MPGSINQRDAFQLRSTSGVPLDVPVDPDTTLQIASDNHSPEGIAEAFWSHSPIQLSRWNQLYPYQLLILRAVKDAKGGVSHQAENGWAFTLPMPPEAYSISMPFAISTAATMGGIIEEHNGAPFRMISMRGSFGMLPARSAALQQLGFSFAETVAGGTVAQLRRVGGDFEQLKSSASGVVAPNPNIHREKDFNDSMLTDSGPEGLVAKTTGYYQFLQLQRFLERYVAIKKTREGRDLRLALATWKDRAVYLVTPQGFEVNKAAGSPMEYMYSLSFKAWKRVTLDTSSFEMEINPPIRRDANKLAQLMNTMQDARRVLQGTSKVVAAVIGDFDRTVLEPLRETVLFTKDVLGVALTLADMPDSINKRLGPSWAQIQGDFSSLKAGASEINDRTKKALGLGRDVANETKDLTSARQERRKKQVIDGHPGTKPFKNPKENFDLMNKSDISVMKMPPAIAQQITAERSRIKNLRRSDFEVRRNRVRAAADSVAIALGAGHATYEDTYGVVVKRLKAVPTQSDWDAMYALNAAAMAMDSYAATGDNEPSSRENTMEVMSGLARRSGIAFRVPTSKFAVPFPYGSTLEGLASLYLGDPNRWQEIAALNGLREPYIDEVGFDILLTTNGVENQVVIPATEELYVGQTVFIWSSAATRTRRRVVGLRTVVGSTIVTVDGDSDMNLYQTVDAAKLSAFTADTVNSQGLIYIPSTAEPAEDNFVTKSIPGVDEFDPMFAVGAVDLLLTSDNDIIITPDGDVRLAIGLTNIIQNTRIALSVKRGTLLHHPNFGFPMAVGDSTADVNPSEVLSAVRRMFSEDPSFSRIDAVQVVKNGGTMRINAAFTVRGTEQPVPVSYKVKGDFQTA